MVRLVMLRVLNIIDHRAVSVGQRRKVVSRRSVGLYLTVDLANVRLMFSILCIWCSSHGMDAVSFCVRWMLISLCCLRPRACHDHAMWWSRNHGCLVVETLIIVIPFYEETMPLLASRSLFAFGTYVVVICQPFYGKAMSEIFIFRLAFL
jgi:hypothetical protein